MLRVMECIQSRGENHQIRFGKLSAKLVCLQVSLFYSAAHTDGLDFRMLPSTEEIALSMSNRSHLSRALLR